MSLTRRNDTDPHDMNVQGATL
ncbi:hypothetical protein AGR2A_Lc180025 [Agrobacterium genomosp. 2 str. CFBP 5494]|uniref:Uncharacterized protein n=2 Tax=Agrobacterium TaxID=357 RepID=U4Q1L7_9HYPH|nr:protein of unknown function [Agrobacterium pusense]CUW96363.1 hypothetical protein AGR2A_Lc180025 [Agrobacterium genomosp. 2 str. CFBP 5494]